MHLGIVKLGYRRRRGQVALIDQHRVIVGFRDRAQLRNVFIKLHIHQAVLAQRVHGDGFAAARLKPEQRFGHGYLVNQGLRLSERGFGNAVAGLNNAGFGCFFGGFHPGGVGEKTPNIDCIGGVIGALVNHLEHVRAANDAGRNLHAPSAPAIGKRHFAGTKRHLVAGNRHGLEQGPANHFFGALVQKSEVVVLIHHAAFCIAVTGPALAGSRSFSAIFSCAWAARSLRTSSSSD